LELSPILLMNLARVSKNFYKIIRELYGKDYGLERNIQKCLSQYHADIKAKISMLFENNFTMFGSCLLHVLHTPFNSSKWLIPNNVNFFVNLFDEEILNDVPFFRYSAGGYSTVGIPTKTKEYAYGAYSIITGDGSPQIHINMCYLDAQKMYYNRAEGFKCKKLSLLTSVQKFECYNNNVLKHIVKFVRYGYCPVEVTIMFDKHNLPWDELKKCKYTIVENGEKLKFILYKFYIYSLRHFRNHCSNNSGILSIHIPHVCANYKKFAGIGCIVLCQCLRNISNDKRLI